MSFNVVQKVDKVVPIVQGFLNYLKKAAPEASVRAEEHWAAYKPELKKCKTREEVARLMLSYFERTMKSIKDIDGKKFIRVKSVGTKKLRIALFTLGVNKNTVRDYVSQVFKIEGRPVEESSPNRQEKPREGKKPPKEPELGKPISVDELRKRVSGKPRMGRRLTKDMVAAGVFVIVILFLFVSKILG